MRRKKDSDKLPFLTEYIRWAVDWRRGMISGIMPTTVLTGLGISTVAGLVVSSVVGSIGTPVGLITGATLFCGYVLGSYVRAAKRSRVEPSQAQLRREAKQIAERLEAILDKKRLHRDLSMEVATLLEEAACSWHRARTALESPYWRRADLPSHLRSAREQSVSAIDQGMQEMLVMFATSVPARPGKWHWTELVDEVVGQDMLASRHRLDHISPFFDEAHAVAEKLSQMADQVEQVARRLAGEELISGAPKPGSGLEATLAELRQLKEAEDELRQDLHG